MDYLREGPIEATGTTRLISEATADFDRKLIDGTIESQEPDGHDCCFHEACRL